MEGGRAIGAASLVKEERHDLGCFSWEEGGGKQNPQFCERNSSFASYYKALMMTPSLLD